MARVSSVKAEQAYCSIFISHSALHVATLPEHQGQRKTPTDRDGFGAILVLAEEERERTRAELCH